MPVMCKHHVNGGCNLGIEAGKPASGYCAHICVRFEGKYHGVKNLRGTDQQREHAAKMVKASETRATVEKKNPCAHRGERVDKVKCDSCGGHRMLDVYQCTVHGRCCVGKTTDGIKTCIKCRDFTAIAPAPSAPSVQDE